MNTQLLNIISTEQAWHYGIVPLSNEGNELHFQIDEEKWINGVEEELEIILGKSVRLSITPHDTVHKQLSTHYLRGHSRQEHTTAKTFSARQSDDFLPALIAEARQLNSSDIHIETFEERARVRIRIDGLLIERYQIAKNDYPALVNKIKIRANLDIAEKRLPQDGRIYFRHEGSKTDIRVSVLPTLHGEKVVLRLLGSDATGIDIRTLGLDAQQLDDYMEGIKKPHGILLISGPTGSGKTTTLYATLKVLNKESANIVTVEDPIEYTLEGVNQVQLKESIGLTFAGALRTFLRQDPDIIMLGEIRDAETAQMAVRAALTGHLVLSTIHTNSAWGTISRLTDMGVPPFLIASTLNTSVAQRLVRLLCPSCKEKTVLREGVLPKKFQPPHAITHVWEPVGCADCHYTGYRGRKAIYEVVPIDHDLAEKIRMNSEEPTALYAARNISTLEKSAFTLLATGNTSPDEVYAILSSA
jgi:type IV pilus assembly protein PilB